MDEVVFPYVKLTNQLLFKAIFQNVDQHTGGKWLIHGTKHREDNQLQSLELHCGTSFLRMYIWHKGVRW